MNKIIYGACICMTIIASLEACRVAFHATSAARLVQPKVGHALLLPTILTNEGGGYDPKTGVFTAPVSGTYDLGIQVFMKGFGSLMGASMEVDGKKVSYLEAYNRHSYDESYAHAVVFMEKGKKASVICRALRPHRHVKVIGEHHTIFSGFLIPQ